MYNLHPVKYGQWVSNDSPFVDLRSATESLRPANPNPSKETKGRKSIKNAQAKITDEDALLSPDDIPEHLGETMDEKSLPGSKRVTRKRTTRMSRIRQTANEDGTSELSVNLQEKNRNV